MPTAPRRPSLSSSDATNSDRARALAMSSRPSVSVSRIGSVTAFTIVRSSDRSYSCLRSPSDSASRRSTCASFSANTDANHSSSGVMRRVPPERSAGRTRRPSCGRLAAAITWNAPSSNGVVGRRRRSCSDARNRRVRTCGGRLVENLDERIAPVIGRQREVGDRPGWTSRATRHGQRGRRSRRCVETQRLRDVVDALGSHSRANSVQSPRARSG